MNVTISPSAAGKVDQQVKPTLSEANDAAALPFAIHFAQGHTNPSKSGGPDAGTPAGEMAVPDGSDAPELSDLDTERESDAELRSANQKASDTPGNTHPSSAQTPDANGTPLHTSTGTSAEITAAQDGIVAGTGSSSTPKHGTGQIEADHAPQASLMQLHTPRASGSHVLAQADQPLNMSASETRQTLTPSQGTNDPLPVARHTATQTDRPSYGVQSGTAPHPNGAPMMAGDADVTSLDLSRFSGSGAEKSLSPTERHLARLSPTLELAQPVMPDKKPPATIGSLMFQAAETRSDRRATSLPALINAQSTVLQAGTAPVQKLGLAFAKTVPFPLSVGSTGTFETSGARSEELIWDVRMPTGSNASVHATQTLRAEMPAHMPPQLAAALTRHPDRPIEIALNPAELGRVRMILSATDAGITVNIIADRPETLDLMRRNIDELGRSLSDLGYEDASFAFQQDSTANEGDGKNENARSDTAQLEHPTPETDAVTTMHTVRLAVAPDGIDMRF